MSTSRVLSDVIMNGEERKQVVKVIGEREPYASGDLMNCSELLRDNQAKARSLKTL